MATTDWWKQTLVQEVYYPVGRFNHDHGKKRFVRAPFILVKTQGVNDGTWTDYWMPAPFPCGSLNNAGGGLMRDYLNADGGDAECRHPFGYITKQDIIMEQSELGDWTPIGMEDPEDNDNWKRFHRIGMI